METKARFESLPLGLLLTLTGGSLDCYTYQNRGQVFATAETGNMVLLGAQVAKGRLDLALRYLPPSLAYTAGVLGIDGFSRAVDKRVGQAKWRQIVLLLECAVTVTIGFLPVGRLDALANILISFTSAMQVESFRIFAGCSCATTMCTGNLRSGTENLYLYLSTGNREAGQKAAVYYALIVCFVTGAVIGAIATPFLGSKSIFLSCVFLAAAVVMLSKQSHSATLRM